jgi:hypothetical protein
VISLKEVLQMAVGRPIRTADALKWIKPGWTTGSTFWEIRATRKRLVLFKRSRIQKDMKIPLID